MDSSLRIPIDATPMPEVAVSRGWREFAVYFGAAAAGFCADAGALMFLVQGLHMGHLIASTLAFLAGTLVVYGISVRFAFDYRRVRDTRSEFIVFALIGLSGLAVTLLVMWAGVDKLAIDFRVTKLGAAGASFLTNYAMRKVILFTAA